MAATEKELTKAIKEKKEQIARIREELNGKIRTHEDAIEKIQGKLKTDRSKRREKIRELNKKRKDLEDACFVATALYGDIEHPVVRDLRLFRDLFLMQSSVGRATVSFYYRIGPVLASRVRPTSAMSAFMRILLSHFVRITGVRKLREE